MIKRIKKRFQSKILHNYYNTKHRKKVLISYITQPFLDDEILFSHSNYGEVKVIVQIFKELNFNIDIVEFSYKKSIDFSKYDVLFGMGDVYEKSLQLKNHKQIHIYYATGSYFCFQNAAEINRLNDLFRRRGVLLKPRRFVTYPKYLATQLSDAIITTGNDFTVGTYVNSKMPIYKVPISVHNFFNNKNIVRNVEKAKKNFLWFGSAGLVHKGLDVCLEVFKDLPEYTLHICGPREDDFFELYQKELSLENIHYHGFVDIQSEQYRDIVSQCLFSIFPSCSEGGGGALLTTMATGLIPIATIEASVDMEDLGFIIDTNINIELIKRLIHKITLLSEEKLLELSSESEKYVVQNHNILNFSTIMKSNLIKILEEL